MSIAKDDRWLWVGLGIFTVLAIRSVYNGRKDLLRLSEVPDVPPEPPKQWEVTQRTEDAVNANALFELWKGSTSTDIRRSAAKILIERALTDDAIFRSIISDLGLPAESPGSQHAQMLERYVTDHTDLQTQLLWSRKRDDVLRGIMFARDPHSIDRRDLISSLREWSSADGHGRPMLRNLRRARPLETSEAEARRRRREAVVLHEGDAPITAEDIFQRLGGPANMEGGRAPGLNADLIAAIESGLEQLRR